MTLWDVSMIILKKSKFSRTCKWFIWIYMSGKINIHEGLHLCNNKSLPIPLSNKQCQSQMSCQIQFELACCEIVKNLWQILSTRHLLCWSVEMDKHYISAILAILEHISWLCSPLIKDNIYFFNKHDSSFITMHATSKINPQVPLILVW